MLLLRSPALERENDEKSVGAWLLLPNPTVPSGWQSSLCPRHPTACCQCSCWDRVAHRVLGGAPPLTSRRSVAVGLAAGWAHLLATAESWSRMRPSPSNIVSRVSLLSSTVTAETEGLSPHRLGSSWIFIWSRQVGTAMRLMLSEAVLMSTLQSRSTRRGREIRFAWASVLQVDLYKRERWEKNHGKGMRIESSDRERPMGLGLRLSVISKPVITSWKDRRNALLQWAAFCLFGKAQWC